jgi:aldehyde dehydrogenase (NAD+)
MTITHDATAVEGEPRLYIDGVLREARSGVTFDNVSPSTSQVIGVTTDADLTDADAAVAAARRAFDETGWASDANFRSHCLRQLQDALNTARPRFTEILISEVGAPVSLVSATQFQYSVDGLTYWADMARKYPYESALPAATLFGRAVQRTMRRVPAGVVAAITAWNFPVMLNLAKLAPALAAGCTVVLKPAPQTPWSATVIGQLIAEQTDIPPGVVNIVPSSDPAVGQFLSSDPRVDMVTFVGSTAVGRMIMQQAAPTVKRLFLELGGKSANIVLDDADFAATVPGASYMCVHAGQGCALLTRLLLPAKRYDEGVALIAESFDQLRCGDPRDPATVVGPLITGAQRERVLAHINRAVEQGGRVLVGGEAAIDPPRGFYVEPTLIVDVDPESDIAQQEVFGPVLCVIRYTDEDDAVRIANNTIFGLSASVHSASPQRARCVARRMRSGTVGINGAHWMAVDTPFGGFKQSGVGRENGMPGFEEYLETTVMSEPAEPLR